MKFPSFTARNGWLAALVLAVLMLVALPTAWGLGRRQTAFSKAEATPFWYRETTNSNQSIDFLIPLGWELVESTSESSMPRFVSREWRLVPSDDTSRFRRFISLSLTHGPPSYTLMDLIHSDRRGNLVSTVFLGRPAFLDDHASWSALEKELVGRTVYFEDKPNFVSLTLSTSTAFEEADEAIFDAFVASLRIRQDSRGSLQ